jgi:hypothetical protein
MDEDELRQLASDVTIMRDRQAIWDCLMRYSRGVDRFDRDLVLSAYHPDALDDHGKFLGSPAEFWDWAHDQHSRVHLSHQHYIANHSCELDGDVAHTETYYMFAAICREGAPVAITGGRYVDRFEKRGGEWRIAYRVCTRDWALLDERPNFDDASTFTSTRHLLSPALRQFMSAGFRPRRDTEDVSYLRPLMVDPARQAAWQALKA